MRPMTGEDRAIYAINYTTLIERSGWKGKYLEDAKRSDLMKRGDEETWWEMESQIDNYYFHKFMLGIAEDNINNGNGGKGMGIIPLYKAYFNGRQMAQSGIELMPCTFDGFTRNLAAVFDIPENEINNPPEVRMGLVSKTPHADMHFPDFIIKFVFAPEMEDDAWRMLDQANINAATIYPDIDGIAKSVRYNDRILGL